MKKKVVVIGGSGFLGGHVSDALSEAGYDVTIFDSRSSPWLRAEQKMVVGDVRNEDAVQECLKNAHYVYHLAGIADIDEAMKFPRNTVEHNIMGSMCVMESCVKAKVERLIFASTVYVYSRQGSFYRVSKQAVESLLEVYHEHFDLEYTVLRYGSLYGPRAQAWNGLKRFVAQAVKDGKIVYPGCGNERREYIHVKDAAHLSVQVLAEEYANQYLTITGTHVVTSGEMLNMIQEILGKKVEIEFRQDSSNYRHSHYTLTPYRYTPREARKLVPNVFIDIGQGILDLLEEVHHELESEKELIAE